MKKTTFIYLLAACAGSLIISGYNAGAGSTGFDCTGADTGTGNPTGCGTIFCHTSAASSAITVSVELDSAGISTTHYTGGMSYTIKLSGANTGTSSLPKFGFQMSTIIGSVGSTAPVNAGTWPTPYPQSTHYTAPSGLFTAGLVEQSSALLATTGTGGAGTTYVKTVNWTAPVSGTGTISLWAALNAVNGNGTQDAGDLWNTTHLVINEWGGAAGIADAQHNASNFKLALLPNPAVDNIHLTYYLSKRSIVSVNVFDINGRLATELLNETQNEGEQNLDAGVSKLSKGIYYIILNVDGLKIAKKLAIQ